jgi:hypothetical protein
MKSDQAANEMKAPDHHLLAEVEPVRVLSVGAGVEIEHLAAGVPRASDELAQKRRADTLVPMIRCGHEIVQVELPKGHRRRHDPPAGDCDAPIGFVVDGREAKPLRVTLRVHRGKVVGGQMRTQVFQYREDIACEPGISRFQVHEAHAARRLVAGGDA